MIRSDSFLSARPPNIIVPRHIWLTLTPVRPNGRYSTRSPLGCGLACASRWGSRIRWRRGRPEDRHPGLARLLEGHGHGHPDADRLGVAADDVRGEPEPALLLELHNRDHVRHRDVRAERLAVDREREHRAPAADRAGLQRPAAYRARPARGVH